MMTFDNRHKLARPYWARPGIRLATAPGEVIGVGEDADELDEDEDEDEDDDESDDDPDAEKSEDELRAELKRVRASLKTANGSSASKRGKIKSLKAELAKLQGSKPAAKADKDEGDELDVEAIREQARAEGRKAGEDKLKTAEVRTALAKAGVTDDKALARLARMVDLDELDVNDDGTVDGLDEAIDELKGDLPDLFAKPRRRRQSVAGDDDRDGQARDVKRKSASEQAADKLLGRGGR